MSLKTHFIFYLLILTDIGFILCLAFLFNFTLKFVFEKILCLVFDERTSGYFFNRANIIFKVKTFKGGPWHIYQKSIVICFSHIFFHKKRPIFSVLLDFFLSFLEVQTVIFQVLNELGIINWIKERKRRRFIFLRLHKNRYKK